MMAESLPCCGPMGTLAGWELEAWYEDLQDILCSEIKNADSFQAAGCEEQNGQMPVDASNDLYQWTFETDCPLSVELSDEDVIALEAVVDQLPTEVLEFISPVPLNDNIAPSESQETENVQSAASEPEPCYSSSPSQIHTEDEESSTSLCGTKRKRSSKQRGGKVRVKEREQENDKKVSYLVAENERLKAEIERLSVEVEKTRKDLIERMVNLKRV
ncbi:DNA damage-inducible transcript 3 protein [Pelobates fuscus]|uniref:DNA damage-inducible transcript 3 protein n=1 Tax=Pelobates fuscus TaxID=191477 RepID=UPI002FE43829